MKKAAKCLIAIASVAFIVIILLDNDFSQLRTLPKERLLPILLITLITFLIKAGILSAILIGLKKLWKWFRK
jgi:hypothetical protein